MKTLKLLFTALIVSLTTLSCSSDDDNNTTTNSLVGKWTYEKEEALDANGKVISTYIPTEYEFCGKNVLDFQSDGAYVVTQYEYYLNNCNQYTSVIGTWKLEGNLLTVEFDDEKDSQTVKFAGDIAEFEAPLSRDQAGDYELNVVKLRTILKKVK